MSRVAVVTGSNRGIGLSLVRGLCTTWSKGDCVYLTARNAAAGTAALRQLASEGLHPAFHLLDIAADDSVRKFAGYLADRHGGVDVLIQNGAYAVQPHLSSVEQVWTTINTNNLGTSRILNAFRPLLRAQARVVVIASGFGTLASLPEHLHARFAADDLRLADIDRTMTEYVQAVQQRRDHAEGWPEWINIPSKVGQVAATRAFARELRDDCAAPPGVLVNAACPGWTRTDAARPYLETMPHIQAKMPDEAAVDVLWLATLPRGTQTPYAQLVQYRQSIPFDPNPSTSSR